MGSRAVHFALTPEEATQLMDTPGTDPMAFVVEIESRWDKEWLQETDKAWDAIHRCLTNGKLEYGSTVFHKCILGADNLYDGDDYVISFLDAEEVQEVADAIRNIDREWMRKKYDAIDKKSYEDELSDEDFEYTWAWFGHLQKFFQKAASHGRAMIFTVGG